MKQYLFFVLCISSSLYGSQQTKPDELAARMVDLYPYVDPSPKLIKSLAITIAQNPARLSALRKAVQYKERSYQRRTGGAIRSVNYLAQCMLETLSSVQENAQRERLKTLFVGFIVGSCAMLLIAQRLRAFTH